MSQMNKFDSYRTHKQFDNFISVFSKGEESNSRALSYQLAGCRSSFAKKPSTEFMLMRYQCGFVLEYGRLCGKLNSQFDQ